MQEDYGAAGILDELVSANPVTDATGTYDNLGTLYLTILKNAFDIFRANAERIQNIQKVLIWIAVSVGVMDVNGLGLIGIPSWAIRDTVNRLRSVLIVDGDITPATEIRECHASFPQFLSDSARCTDPAFLVDPPSGHATIATSLLDLLARDDVDSLRDADGNMPRMWVYAGLRWDGHLGVARYTPELGRALRGFVETHLEDWLQKKDTWDSPWDMAPLVDFCADVRTWYKNNGPDDGLAAELDTIIDRRVEEIVAEAAQSPDKFRDRHLKQIKVWAEKGYTW
ncbi:hypothetical protein CERSUDRAFT_99725 [Gelatoporia subvermispora B]|uniref:Uncharacterized protein n=1 Tax=Ceriporiopsis subvermispora (strain B) TaxID=914234 RepID=M2QIU6_CERS8|nr:hypothetical protein CERSUDRAFT_99725 [Gelatoporia subvermispora B]